MSSTFLYLTNRVLTALNEVNLTSSNFSTATGFAAEAQEAIKQAVFDIYTYQDTEWPFLWSNFTFNTVAGTTDYTKDATVTSIDWDSFKIARAVPTVVSITQTGGVATVTTSSAHNFVVGDNINISGATQSGYNSAFNVATIPSPTTFTIAVDSSTVSPATGTILLSSNTLIQKKLFEIDYDKYRTDFWDQDKNLNPTQYSVPTYIVRKADNNFILSTVPDRVYSIYYEGFVLPAALSLYTDTVITDTAFDQVIVDKALHYAYMFRDNLEQAAIAQDRYEKNIFKMRRILIPQSEFARFSY